MLPLWSVCVRRNVIQNWSDLLFFFRVFLNAVISRFSFESRRLQLVLFVHITRSKRTRVSLTSAVFERNNASVAVLSELHDAVSHLSDRQEYQTEKVLCLCSATNK
jgi:hypothetical protein